MATYRKVRMLGREEAAYIAGLIDGEGTISLSRKHANDNRQLVVSISSTESTLLRYALATIGAGRITSKRTYRTNHAPGFTYVIENRQALALLEQISPYLRTYKARRAALVLENYVRLTPRNGKYTSVLRREREVFVATFLDTLPER